MCWPNFCALLVHGVNQLNTPAFVEQFHYHCALNSSAIALDEINET